MTMLQSKKNELRILADAAYEVLDEVQKHNNTMLKASKFFVLKKYTAFQLLYNSYVEKHESLTNKAFLERIRNRVLLACEAIYVKRS